MKEIRIHGRGGQGSVTMAQLLAEAAFEGGMWAQGFPSFGVERLGAPIQAFTRIDDVKVMDRSQIEEPDFVIVQDSTLLELVDVVSGLKGDGLVLVNTSAGAGEVSLDTGADVLTVDATSIALEHLGRPIMNTALLGAFAGATGLFDLDVLEGVILDEFSGEVGESNVAAAEDAFGRVV